MSTAPHLALGRAAEAAAARHLERLGYRLVTTNFRAKGGELDIVADDDGVLAIIEVRYRASNEYGGAAASITPAKRTRIIRASKSLLLSNPPLAKLSARFDVVEVSGPPDNLQCHLIRAAFSL